MCDLSRAFLKAELFLSRVVRTKVRAAQSSQWDAIKSQLLTGESILRRVAEASAGNISSENFQFTQIKMPQSESMAAARVCAVFWESNTI